LRRPIDRTILSRKMHCQKGMRVREHFPRPSTTFSPLTPSPHSTDYRQMRSTTFTWGDPVEMLQLFPDGTGKVITLGSDIVKGMQPQVIAMSGIWQGSRLLPGGKCALLGTTMSPGFEPADYEAGTRQSLVHSYPQFRGLIYALTH